FRDRDHRGRPVVADGGSDAPQCAEEPGHVPRRGVPHVPRADDRDRRAGLRPRADGARSAHPARRRRGAMNARDLEAIPGEPEHFVSTEPFDPTSAARLTPEQERFYLASQWRLMWWKFRRHRLAVVSGVILLLMYGSTLISEVLVPYNLHTRNTDFIYAPPQTVHLFHDGHFIGPFVYALKKSLNMETLRRDYAEDRSRPYP